MGFGVVGCGEGLVTSCEPRGLLGPAAGTRLVMRGLLTCADGGGRGRGRLVQVLRCPHSHWMSAEVEGQRLPGAS